MFLYFAIFNAAFKDDEKKGPNIISTFCSTSSFVAFLARDGLAFVSFIINSLSILSPFENDEKQALLEAKTIKERVTILTTLMEMSIKAETTFGPLQ